MTTRDRVLIAGVGGASLGTELMKALASAGRYDLFGCDIAPLAYGLYGELKQSWLVPKDGYVDAVIDLCLRQEIRVIVAGGEAPLGLLSSAAKTLRTAGIRLAANDPAVVAACSDKAQFFDRLRDLGVAMPHTVTVTSLDGIGAAAAQFATATIVKPATGSGGSSSVFLAEQPRDIELYVTHILRSGAAAVVQEYLSEAGGEYTIGVLSLADQTLVGSIALRREFHSKLSVSYRSAAGVISSGYSQGLIDDFGEIRMQAEELAMRFGSAGPFNVQARIRNGVLVPFEVNPRFSASTYLRALAGFNEVDIYLQHLLHGVVLQPEPLRPGYYLRSLEERYVPREAVHR